MNKLGLTEQQLLDHLTRMSAPNEWGTDLELRMLGALAGIDVVSINTMDSDCDRWRLDPIYNHTLTPPVECDPIYQGQKLGILYHQIFYHVGAEHFDPFYLVAQ